MFGFGLETTLAAGIALVAFLAAVPLFMQKNVLALAGALGVGSVAWIAGGLTVPTFTGFASAFVAAALALLTAVVAAALEGLGVGVDPRVVVLVLLAFFLLSRGRGKKK